MLEKVNKLKSLHSLLGVKIHFHVDKSINHVPSILQRCAIVPPSIIALIISAAILSKRSAPRAAQSPTLSPTFNLPTIKNSNVYQYESYSVNGKRFSIEECIKTKNTKSFKNERKIIIFYHVHFMRQICIIRLGLELRIFIS